MFISVSIHFRKPSSAQFATRKLAKQEAFNEGDEMLLNALAETKRRAVSLAPQVPENRFKFRV